MGKATSGTRASSFLRAGLSNDGPGTVQIRFGVAQSAPARIRVFDVAGRVVRSLLDATLPAGEHARVWDGRSDHGTIVAAGIYLVRLEAGTTVISQKVVLAK